MLIRADRERVGREASPSAVVIDNESIKTTESDCPYGYDAGKKVKGRKRRLAFRAMTVERSPELLDRELQMPDQRLGAGQVGLGTDRFGTGLGKPGLGRHAGRALGEDHRVCAGKIGKKRFDEIVTAPSAGAGQSPPRSSLFVNRQAPWPSCQITDADRFFEDVALPSRRCRNEVLGSITHEQAERKAS